MFETEKIDLDMLLDLRDEEMMDMFKNIGIVSWGIRHKFKRAVEDLKPKKDDVNIENKTNEEHNIPKMNDNDGKGKANYNDSTLDDIEDEVFSNSEDLEGETAITDIEEDETSSNECPLCRDSTQHHCRKCGKLVCILFCSIMDPRSDNELHVVHIPGDIRAKFLVSQLWGNFRFS